MTRKMICSVVVTACMLCFASIASAETMVIGDAVSLADLIENPDAMVVVEDKKFTDFTYDATGDMPDAEFVNVIPIVELYDPGNGVIQENYGIRFQGGFLDLPDDVSPGGPSDAFITYNVMVTDPNRIISDVHLAGNPAVSGGTGFAGVTETFLPTFDDVQLQIFSNFGLTQADWYIFDEEDYKNWDGKMLNVQKDILLEAGTGLAASISFVDQTFSQVPEPSTCLLLLGGFLGLLAARRR